MTNGGGSYRNFVNNSTQSQSQSQRMQRKSYRDEEEGKSWTNCNKRPEVIGLQKRPNHVDGTSGSSRQNEVVVRNSNGAVVGKIIKGNLLTIAIEGSELVQICVAFI